jgi:hypothetical protein
LIFFSQLSAYGRFLSTRIITNPMSAIATIMPMTAGTKYCSTIGAGGCVAAGVAAGASPTLM